MGQIERGESKIQRRASIKRALDAKVIYLLYFKVFNIKFFYIYITLGVGGCISKIVNCSREQSLIIYTRA